MNDPLITKYISIDPEICHGKPCFRIGGRPSRIMVYLVLELLETGVPIREIISRKYYPRLTPTHIKAALHFAAEQLKNRQLSSFYR